MSKTGFRNFSKNYRFRDRAAFFAPFEDAVERLARPLVRAAFFAAAEREAGERFSAAARACSDNAWRDTDPRLSRLSAFTVARERLVEVSFGSSLCPLRYARSALRRVFSDVFPLAGGLRSTPARRALDNPIAIACFAERAP
jgi:hypothetical protein